MELGEREDWGNGLAEGKYVRVIVGYPGSRLCVLWLSDNEWFSAPDARLMMFFGLPFGIVLRGAWQFLIHPAIPFHKKVTETVLAPVKALRFIVTGKSVGLWGMDF